MNIRLLLIFVSCAHSQPILSQIGEIFGSLGFKYVPPPSPTPTDKVSNAGLFQPVEKETRAVVFTENSGWLQSSGSDFLYRLGQEATTYYEAKYWCEEQGGRLAEIYDQEEMDTVRALVKRQPRTHFWIGLEKTASTWLSSGARRDYQDWAGGEPSSRVGERCVVLSHLSQYRWAGWNCGSQTGGASQVRALCQKEPSRQQLSTQAPELKSEPETPRCEVSGVSLTGNDWISRHRNVSSSSACRQNCLTTYHCKYWTWRADSRLCYLKSQDGQVVEDVFSISGTTSEKQGCHNKLLDTITTGSSPVEYCTCKTISLPPLDSGYIDPRSLSSGEDKIDYSEVQLGRLLLTSACPYGQVLSCTDDQKVTVKAPQLNLTDCLAYDVRLSVGNLISKVLDVPDAATCHAHCLATQGCLYWTWRGDTKTRKCFLLPNQGRVVRRQRAASGTVASAIGCNHQLQGEAELRQEQEEVCSCQPDSDYDLVSTGLIDPRALPSGRIVNTQAVVCPPGYKNVCYVPKDAGLSQESFESDGPQLWTAGLSLGAEGPGRNIPKRETDSQPQSESAVNFPQ